MTGGGGTEAAGAAGLEAVPVSGASLNAEFDFAAASEAAGAGDSSLLLLHAARTDVAAKQAKRTDLFKIVSFRRQVEWINWTPMRRGSTRVRIQLEHRRVPPCSPAT